jgi:EAL domain-containing protein (putative c-di-GMP-specific phosphodiesterase class I)/DNA-binding NarL/FixJ family response regulator
VSGRLRVLVAEDDAQVRSALSELIDSEPDLDLVGAVADARAAIELATESRPDVVLLDVNMPGGGGEVAARGIRKGSPGSKMIVLTGSGDRATVLRMLQAGVVGYLVKGASVVEIIEAIRRAPEGQASLSHEITTDVIQELAAELNTRYRVSERRRQQERRIRRALADDGNLTMVFQPIVELRDRRIVGAEALARFAGPPRRGPSAWFEEARVVGLAEELELCAVRRAVTALDELPANLFLTVNVSPATLSKERFLRFVAEIDSARLVAEVTEHAPIRDYDRLADAVGRLREHGVRLAIDDAGAGFASLRHILRLNPDVIKLDLTLIRDIHRDQSKRALAAGLISFAHESQTTIIAEGIERAAEAKTLVDLGVEEAQGYYFGRPGPLPLGRRPS